MTRFDTKNWLGSSLMLGILLLIGGQLAGCAGKDVNPEDPASLMEDAEADIKSDHYQIAIDKLRMLKNRFPYSKEAAIAQLRVGDVYFLQEAFGEASASYEAFRDQYPKHEKVSYAILRIGKSFESDIPENPGRDMASATKAIESYQEYLNRFPQGAERKDAQESINKIRSRLAEKEFAVALFYLRRGDSLAGRNRLTKLQSLYPETESARLAREKMASLPEEKTE